MADASGITGSSVESLINEYYTITNNIANASTAGYKRQVNSFSRELARQLTGLSEQAPLPAAQITTRSMMDFNQGSLEYTGRSLDIAINGRGFLGVETPQGRLYTRNGVLHINNLGQLVDLDERIVAGQNGPIIIPENTGETQISITEDGALRAGELQLGKLQIFDFRADESSLVPAGRSCYSCADTNIVPETAQKVSVKQGYREKSNVGLMEELVALVTVSRMYETNMSFMKKQQENDQAMLSVANS